MAERKEPAIDWEQAADELEEFLNMVLDATGLELDAEIDVFDPENPVDVEAPNIIVDLTGPDARLLLEDRHELLRSLEYLAHRWVRLEPSHAARIRFDSNGHRGDRITELGLAARTAEGSLEGVIAREPRGASGFGYDPIFDLPELGKRLAELSMEQKNEISHRGKAMASAKAIIEELLRRS